MQMDNFNGWSVFIAIVEIMEVWIHVENRIDCIIMFSRIQSEADCSR